MKKSFSKFIVLGSLVTLTLTYSCKKLLNQEPVGSLSQTVLANKAGVDGLLIGAYHMLTGFSNTEGAGSNTDWEGGIDNWTYGGIASDDAYKGSSTTDQGPYAPEIEAHTLQSDNEYVLEKWYDCYVGVQRANDAIREVPLVKDGSVSTAYGAEVVAEAKFLRGVFHMELAKVFRNAPYVDETVTYGTGNFNVPNPGPIWGKIEADFTAAMTVLPKGAQPQAGRANYYAAEAMRAGAYMFDHNYTAAIADCTDVIQNGKTASGQTVALEPFENNFNASFNNGPESVFAVQMTTHDGSGGVNGNPGLVLAVPQVTPFTTCCGFYQPSVSLANAFQTVNGLPILGYSTGTTLTTGGIPNDNLTDIPNDHGYGFDATGQYRLATVPASGTTTYSGPAFTPTTNELDPRIDWTLGRYGIPYLDWGLCGGETWSRGDITPYNPIKNVFYQAAEGTTADAYGTWAGNQDIANNYNLVRLAEVYLWRAEAEVEQNLLDAAETDVNTIRNRMAQHPEYWVHQYLNNANPTGGSYTDNNHFAAHYVINPYPAGYFTAQGQAVARNAVEVERQLETGMEGKRFFDLQRYDPLYGGKETASFLANIDNAHKSQDSKWLFLPTYASYVANPSLANPVLNEGSFTAGRNELFPIPITQIQLEGGQLKQNPGYQ